MNLMLISQKIWRHRVATLPVVVLTLLGAFYVIVLKDPEYEAYSSYVLINPPAPPTAEEIAADPTLGRIDPNNPYTRFTDQSVVVDLLASSLSSETARRALSEEGADSYTVAPSSEFGYSGLLVEITGTGSTPDEAVRTAQLVGTALSRELRLLQSAQGVANRYRIETQQVAAPDNAEQRVSGKLRSLVGVFAIGAILLFVVISAAEGLATLRTQRSREGRSGSREGRSGWKDKLDAIGGRAGIGTSGSRSTERHRRARSAGGKNGVAKAKEGQDPIEDPAAGGDNGSNGSPGHERQRRPRGSGTKA